MVHARRPKVPARRRSSAGEHRPNHPDDGGVAGMMAVRRIRAERSPNRAARLRQEHNTLLARMPPDTMRTGLARAAARGIQACGQKWHTSSAPTTRGAGHPRAITPAGLSGWCKSLGGETDVPPHRGQPRPARPAGEGVLGAKCAVLLFTCRRDSLARVGDRGATMDPLYKPGTKSHAVLRYGWIGWPAQGTAFPETMRSFVTVPSEDWERRWIPPLGTSLHARGSADDVQRQAAGLTGLVHDPRQRTVGPRHEESGPGRQL